METMYVSSNGWRIGMYDLNYTLAYNLNDKKQVFPY